MNAKSSLSGIQANPTGTARQGTWASDTCIAASSADDVSHHSVYRFPDTEESLGAGIVVLSTVRCRSTRLTLACRSYSSAVRCPSLILWETRVTGATTLCRPVTSSRACIQTSNLGRPSPQTEHALVGHGPARSVLTEIVPTTAAERSALRWIETLIAVEPWEAVRRPSLSRTVTPHASRPRRNAARSQGPSKHIRLTHLLVGATGLQDRVTGSKPGAAVRHGRFRADSVVRSGVPHDRGVSIRDAGCPAPWARKTPDDRSCRNNRYNSAHYSAPTRLIVMPPPAGRTMT